MSGSKSRAESGLKEAQEALDFARETTSEEGPRVLEAVRDLGVACLRAGDLVRARELLASVVAAEPNAPEAWSYVTADAAHRLGHVLNRLGDLEEARHIQEQVLDYCHYDGDDGSIAGLYNWVHTINALGHFTELHRLGDDIIDSRLQRSGHDSRKTIRYLADIAHMWVFIGDYQRATKIYRRIIPQEIYKFSSPLITIKSIAVFLLFVPPGKLLMRWDQFDPSRRWRRELAKRQRSVKKGR